MPEPIALSHARVTLTLRDPLVISKGVEEHVTVVHVTLRWGGAVGHGEAAPYEEDGQTVAGVEAFLDRFAPSLGDDPFAIELIGRRLAEAPGEGAAKAAVDAALHDLVGTLLGQPTWRLLGLAPGGPPTSYTLSLDVPEAMANAARAVADRLPEIRALKLKLGGRDGLDAARVEAVAAVTDAELSVDANEAWTFDEAVELLPALQQHDVRFVEQPLACGSADGPRLKRRSPLPLYADEEFHVLADLPAIAERAHGVNVKLAKCGGIREAVRIAHGARALGLGVMLGCMVESGLGISAAVQLSMLADHVDLDANLMLERDPAPGLTLRAGVQTAADAPGLGVTL